jgi:DNA-binding HxlR family transcriptional regulator
MNRLPTTSRDAVVLSRSPPGRRYLKCSEVWFRLGGCPVRVSLGSLGRKWTPLILLAIGSYRVDRFNRVLETLPDVGRKVLATRLRELERGGMVRRVDPGVSTLFVRWVLTPKGKDALVIVLMVSAFGSKHHADVVFTDRKPRKLHEVVGPKEMRLVSGLL